LIDDNWINHKQYDYYLMHKN